MSNKSQTLWGKEATTAIRKTLKKRFPNTKFYVNLGSGGGAINIRWIDGASKTEVEAILPTGKGFDGMIDMQYYTYDWLLPDGTFQPANNGNGTQGSMGSVPAYETAKPHPQAVMVDFPQFIFIDREYSRETLIKADQDCDWYKELTLDIVDSSMWAGNRQVATIAHYVVYNDYNGDHEHKKRRVYELLRDQNLEKTTPKTTPTPANMPTNDGCIITHERDWTWIYSQSELESIPQGFKYSGKRSNCKGCFAYFCTSHVELTL